MAAERTLSRRRFVRSAVGTVAVAGGMTSVSTAKKPSFDGWLSNTSNYTGVVDKTGQDTVTVEVGVKANNDYYGFGPAAISVSKGTTITWKWTGKGGSHTVTAQSGGDFDSGLHEEQGYTFEHSFDEKGIYKYYCTPHKALGMKGVVVVGDVSLSKGDAGASSGGMETSGESGSSHPDSGGRGSWPAQFVAVGVTAAGFLALIVGSMIAITIASIRNDQHSPSVVRED